MSETDENVEAEAVDEAPAWTAPEGHTTSLDPAIAALGDVHVVDENLPADGIVESLEPDLSGVMTAHTVYAEFAKPAHTVYAEFAKPDADAVADEAPVPAAEAKPKRAPAKKAPAKAPAKKASASK